MCNLGGDDDQTIKLGVLGNESYSVHLLDARDQTVTCLWTTETVFEISDPTLYLHTYLG